MSLADQLKKAGLISNKDVRRVNRDKKKQRKQGQGERRKKKLVEREEAARRAAVVDAERAARVEARTAHERARDALEQAHRVRQIIRTQAVRATGPMAFFVKGADGRRLHRLKVSERVAHKLRAGELGVAETPAVVGRPDELVIVSRRAIDRLLEVAPEAVRFYVGDTKGISEPDEAFLQADWDVSLTPHRVG